jgi:hypothetical protein
MQQTSWARDQVPVSAFNPPSIMWRTWDAVVMLWPSHNPRSPNSWFLQSDCNILQASCHERHPTRVLIIKLPASEAHLNKSIY